MSHAGMDGADRSLRILHVLRSPVGGLFRRRPDPACRCCRCLQQRAAVLREPAARREDRPAAGRARQLPARPRAAARRPQPRCPRHRPQGRGVLLGRDREAPGPGHSLCRRQGARRLSPGGGAPRGRHRADLPPSRQPEPGPSPGRAGSPFELAAEHRPCRLS